MTGLPGIIEQNAWFTEEARTFLAYLILKGEISHKRARIRLHEADSEKTQRNNVVY